MRRWFPLFAAVLLAAPGAPAAEVSELQLKAAFLFHFTQFVDWPEARFRSPDAPFVIGVFGDNAMEAALTAMVKGERVGRHPLEVRHLRGPAEAAACSIVFVPNGSESEFRSTRTSSAPVLSVGESASFLEDGGMIEFYPDHAHVRLRINLQAARAASLQISSKLLRVAQVVSPSSLTP